MSHQSWFSATLRFFMVNSAIGKIRAEDSVFLVKANDFDDAFRKFLALGKQREVGYQNHLSEHIKKRFAAIVTLDIVAGDDLDGAEITSSPVVEGADPTFTIDTHLDPASSKPTQTI